MRGGTSTRSEWWRPLPPGASADALRILAARGSITAVPKTFAWAAGSMISGYLLTLSSLGWPLLIGGVIQGVYDILLLIKFQKARPPEEAGAAA